MASSNKTTVSVFVGTLLSSWNGSLRRYDGAVDVTISDSSGVACFGRKDVCNKRPTDKLKSTAVEASLEVALEMAAIVAIFDNRQRRRFDKGVVCCVESGYGIKELVFVSCFC